MTTETPPPSFAETTARVLQFWPLVGVPVGVGLFAVLFLQGQALQAQSELLEHDVAALHGQVVEVREAVEEERRGKTAVNKGSSKNVAASSSERRLTDPAKTVASGRTKEAGKSTASRTHATGAVRPARKPEDSTARAPTDGDPARRDRGDASKPGAAARGTKAVRRPDEGVRATQ